jgi:Uma2 family endonuclease
LIVTCDPRDTDEYFINFPQALIEVLSPDTERIDRGEKFISYRQVESVEEYILVAQTRMEATVFRRANQWRPEVVRGVDSELRIPSLDFVLPMAAVYESVKL